MDKRTWNAFCKALTQYRLLVDSTSAVVPAHQVQKLVLDRGGASYTVDTPVVYNSALDDIKQDSEIKMILVGDNPGRREQAAENRRYLVGPSGKIAANFFSNHPELGIDFRKNVLILNKTPIHTPRTAELKELCTLGGIRIRDAVFSSQKAMAEILYEFWTALSAQTIQTAPMPIWIIGYSEMKKGGIFEIYTNTLKDLCTSSPAFKENIFFFRHFSMNQFTIDLKQQKQPKESVAECLRRIGAAYRGRILG